jgi:pimeloyl-ACP methyl ester carboxylesterase
LLAGSVGLPLSGLRALAQTALAPSASAVVPPVVFVHGNGDHAALWITTLWRMESNGLPRERMSALSYTNPLARADDKVDQANRSSTEDQRRELGEAVKELQPGTGASRIAVVGNSRGGYSIRNYIRNGGGADTGAGAVVLMSRPRGYFGLPRDVVLIDGKEPKDVKPGVPTDSVTTLRLPAEDAGRAVVAMFNTERIVARAWPASENRIAVAELTY